MNSKSNDLVSVEAGPTQSPEHVRNVHNALLRCRPKDTQRASYLKILSPGFDTPSGIINQQKIGAERSGQRTTEKVDLVEKVG